MELICYSIQNINTLPRQEEESKVQLVLNQDGEEIITHYQEQTVFHNSTIRNIIAKSDVWKNYFDIYYDNSLKGVVLVALNMDNTSSQRKMINSGYFSHYFLLLTF